MTEKSDILNPFKVLAPSRNCPPNPLVARLNDVLEFIFRFTVDKNAGRDYQVVYLEDTASQCPDSLLSLEVLESALFERLLLTNPENFLLPKTSKASGIKYRRVLQTDIVSYLFDCYDICYNLPNGDGGRPVIDASTHETILQVIIKLAARAISYPTAYPDADQIWRKYFKLLRHLRNNTELRKTFFKKVVREVRRNENSTECLCVIICPILKEIERSVMNMQTDIGDRWVLLALEAMVSTSTEVAEIVLDYQTPNPDAEGRDYEHTIFGWYLSSSMELKDHIPSGNIKWDPETLFEVPEVIYHTHRNMSIFGVFKKLLLMGQPVRKKTMMWISNCLYANSTRNNDWYSNFPMMRVPSHASDDFMLGLVGGVLLKFCEPIFGPEYKVLLTDPTYCAVPAAEREDKGVHMRDRCDITCLLPTEEGENLLHSDEFGFITECFFLTHKGIEMTYSMLYEKCTRLSREIMTTVESVRDVMQRDELSESASTIINKQIRKFKELKGFLSEPNTLKLLKNFHEASAVWLLEVTSINASEYDEMVSTNYFAPMRKKDRRLPFDSFVPPYLKSIPEHVLDNFVKFINYFRRFNSDMIHKDVIMAPIFQVILLFMGSNDRARNPHLRAILADALEAFVPAFPPNVTQKSWSEEQFHIHPDRKAIVPNLLNVFVSIEMTGQSVQFEQKFNYRRPMYTIMRYLLEEDEQVNVFKRLAREAQKNMEAVNPPIFLRFVNLLINDAIFLLDESLSNLKKIRDLQLAREDSEWEKLPAEEQRQQEENLANLASIVKFENTIGKDTIHMLQMITQNIKGIFCHASMVDRLASMLNYFLLNLVGPARHLFNVKNKAEYEFNPGEIVTQIAKIYVNLSESNEFCLAVAEDGRSYNEHLFDYAENVLIRIGGGQLIGDIQEVDNKVKEIAAQHKQEQEALGDPPQEFLDPIMSTLMRDPVILPNSRITVDRATILRHFLSDQTDPFNRSTLTMNEVQPNTKLKQEISDWITNKRQEYRDREP